MNFTQVVSLFLSAGGLVAASSKSFLGLIVEEMTQLTAERLIKFENGTTVWMPRYQVEAELVGHGIRFMDITEVGDISAASANVDPQVLTIPLPIRLHRKRDALIQLMHSKLDKERMRVFLEEFTAFHTRYFRSRYGLQSAEWLYETLAGIADASRMKITLERIEHEGWPQFSIIARLQAPGSGDVVDTDERVVLSAHQDSTSAFLPMILPAPGADDDGSGVATMLEAFRILAAHTLELRRPIEFHFYAAEEGGLLGSQAIVQDYQSRRIPAVNLHIDMDGFSGKSEGRKPVMALLADNTNPVLSKFVRVLAKRYTRLPVVDTKCGYACSDHYSWTTAGYSSAAMFESRFEDMSKKIHGRADTVDTLDFDHMQEFVKVALAFALHLTDPM